MYASRAYTTLQKAGSLLPVTIPCGNIPSSKSRHWVVFYQNTCLFERPQCSASSAFVCTHHPWNVPALGAHRSLIIQVNSLYYFEWFCRVEEWFGQSFWKQLRMLSIVRTFDALEQWFYHVWRVPLFRRSRMTVRISSLGWDIWSLNFTSPSSCEWKLVTLGPYIYELIANHHFLMLNWAQYL